MPLIIPALSVVGVVGVAGGVYLIVVTARRYGFSEAGQNVISRPGAMLTGGVLLLMGGCVAGLIATFAMLAASHLKQTWEEELTKMFGRPPDRLEMEEAPGSSLGHSRGVAYYGTKRYRIECSGRELIQKGGEEWWRYTHTATPLDEEPRGAGGEPGGPPPPE